MLLSIRKQLQSLFTAAQSAPALIASLTGQAMASSSVNLPGNQPFIPATHFCKGMSA
jgi:hypothetical protein